MHSIIHTKLETAASSAASFVNINLSSPTNTHAPPLSPTTSEASESSHCSTSSSPRQSSGFIESWKVKSKWFNKPSSDINNNNTNNSQDDDDSWCYSINHGSVMLKTIVR